MEKETCPYYAAAVEDDDADVNSSEKCLQEIFKRQKGMLSARGFCKRCKKVVTAGAAFKGHSAGSLTDIDPSKNN